jgi:asparagine synthetase B (glutamine-hydrolysing)
MAQWDGLPDDPWSLGLPRNRAFDLRAWLPNVFLEKSDRASMLHSVEVRVPFLDQAVLMASRGATPLTSRKQPLRDELHQLLPGVRLPARKMGLTVDSAEVVDASLRSRVNRQLDDPSSVFNSLRPRRGAVRGTMHSASGLAFRLATLDVWQERWA